MMLSDVCLSDVCRVHHVLHGAHSYRKQGALGAAGVRRVWAGAGPQRAAYRTGAGAYRAASRTACYY